MKVPRRPWTLRTRLVVSAVSLIAVVAAVIGSVTAIAFHSYMYGKLDDQLHSVAERAQRPPGPGPVPEALRAAGPLGFVGGGGQPLGTFGALLGEDGDVTASKVVEDSGLRAQESAKPLTGEQRSALEEAAPGTGEGARSVDLPGLGGYRVEAATTTEGYTVLVGIPSAEVSGALTTLIVVEVCVTAAGLLAASIAGTVLVGIALRPLRRVATTATRVSELPCTAARWPSWNGSRTPRPTRAPRSGRWARRSTGCSGTSVRPSRPARRARRGSGSSSRTPATSCAPRWPRSGATPS